MMTTQQMLQTAADLLTPWTQEKSQPEPNRLDVVVTTDDLLTAIATLLREDWEDGYLAAITGVDLGVEAGEIEVLYHFCAGAAVLTLRTRTPREKAAVPSVCDLIPSASFYERELNEMLGVTMKNAPNSDRLFLPEDWPEDVYPLRKDYQPA